ncbi:hypothetical protein CCY99_00590 [Helicobacter sp. 16-1353]|uniref:transcriptional regulator n=1 Tax=Helicobacter sp. 16-1353 TaxID=2004996 RepID=UPI000DCD5363|nr:transcriptional regulator [Helicobacter sp. 16-1353]RAX55230.1 hypothetical protein CCY99_00590 [Helicobacter sp. 16-1353]
MSDAGFVEFVCDVLNECGEIEARNMGDDYFIYIDGKNCFTMCDNKVFVKKYEELEPLLGENPSGIPFNGENECWILDINNKALSVEVGLILKEIIPTIRTPKQRKRLRKR